MELLQSAIDFLLNFDKHLDAFIQTYGAWTYAILFAIVFAETGFVFAPFLPGDSLLFAAGVMCGRGTMDIWWTMGLLTLAATLGDAVNFWIGRVIGPRLLNGPAGKLVKQEHLDRTHEFFVRYGAKAIILARFVPIVRTFMPFVAGIGAMDYKRFQLYNVVGAVIWVVLCTVAGYYFGQYKFVKENFELVVLGIIFVSILPAVIEFILHKRRVAAEARARDQAGIRKVE